MAIIEECSKCTRHKKGMYGIQCSFYGKQPDLDYTPCPHYDPIDMTVIEDHTAETSSQLSNGGMPPEGMTKPNNLLVWSILCTVLCCAPLGIAAIINSAKVDHLWSEGQYHESAACAKNAKSFIIWGSVVGFIVSVIYIFITVAAEL